MVVVSQEQLRHASGTNPQSKTTTVMPPEAQAEALAAGATSKSTTQATTTSCLDVPILWLVLVHRLLRRPLRGLQLSPLLPNRPSRSNLR